MAQKIFENFSATNIFTNSSTLFVNSKKFSQNPTHFITPVDFSKFSIPFLQIPTHFSQAQKKTSSKKKIECPYKGRWNKKKLRFLYGNFSQTLLMLQIPAPFHKLQNLFHKLKKNLH